MYTHELYVLETHACEIYAYKMHAYKVRTRETLSAKESSIPVYGRVRTESGAGAQQIGI
jgi:hypothetical protein